MKRLFLFILVITGLVFGRDYYQKDRIMFCLQKDLPYLTVTYENGIAHTGLSGLDALLQKYQVTKLEKGFKSADATDVVGETDLSRVYSAEFRTPKEWDALHAMIDDFTALPQIISGDLSSINYPTATPQTESYTPNDPRYDEQWFMNKIQADYAWGLWGSNTPGDPNVLVGIVDTGVDTQHPDLDGILYLNPGEDLNSNGVVDASDENGIDDDGNGHVDDFYGWDFADDDNDIRPPSAGVDQALSHGTHTTGIAAAVTDNATGVTGVSFRSKVIATKHSNDADSTTNQPGIYYGYDGILYVAKLGAKFINCSWGGSYLFSYEQNILDEVSDTYGAIVVGAAGNDTKDNDDNPQYPSDYYKCICVAATDNTDHLAYYSNWGSVVDISAPGGEGSISSTAILSTIHWNAGGYTSWQGTSMAAPVVTGAFALLKAWFPGQSRQWYWDQLLNNADPIDDINPDFSGELGSGRVNIYNAIGRNTYPYLTISSYEYTVTGDDGDGQTNPGESANLVLTIKNDPDWQSADNATVTLSSNSPYITFSDNTANLGTIAPGDSVTTTSGDLVFAFTADAPLSPLYIKVTMDANSTAAHPYSYTDSVEVQPSLNQVGFPATQTGYSQPIAAANVTGDANLEVIGMGKDDSLYVFNSDGTVASGFPIYIDYATMGASVGDVDNDGNQEIVIADRIGGDLKIIKGDGTILLSKAVGENIYGNIALANMDADPDLEMVFGTMSKNLHVLNIDGSEMSGFPIAYTSPIEKGVAVGDVDGDGGLEMVFGLLNTDLHAVKTDGTELSGFPVDLSGRIKTTPVIAKIKDGGTHIIVSTIDKKIQRIDSSGNIAMHMDLNATCESTPALCDFNGDGSLDITFGTLDSMLFVVSFNGDSIAPFPVKLDAPIRTSPFFADLDNDKDTEMMISTEGGSIFIYEADGSQYKNFPAVFSSLQNGSGCVADIDNDGDYEVCVGGDNGLNVIDIKDSKGDGNALWQSHQANNARTSYFYFDPSASAIESGETTPISYGLQQNYPNPFNPSTTISYQIAARAQVQLTVYNVLGQKVRELVNSVQDRGIYRLTLNANNLASGVYFYKLLVKTAAEQTKVFQRKMLLIR